MITYTVTVDKYATRWYNDGIYHREDGSAIVYANGDKCWYKNGEWHRDGGPALEYVDDGKYWYYNGRRHREDGPAIEYVDGGRCWYLDGMCLTEEEFNARMNPIKELTVAEISKLLGYDVKIIR
jgi:hypothetical protein